MIIEKHERISIKEQCELLGISESTYYYQPQSESEENLKLMRIIDETYLNHPSYGSRRMTAILRRKGFSVNRKRVQRLMNKMGIVAIYPEKRKQTRSKEHVVYPYLLRNRSIKNVNEVWCSDITYIPVHRGFFYLAAVMDVFSRFVLGWQVSNKRDKSTMDTSFCIEALEDAFRYGKPDIFNTDQGVQFTSEAFTSELKSREIQISMNGKGRCIDNIWVEILWRSVKREDIYLKEGRNRMG